MEVDRAPEKVNLVFEKTSDFFDKIYLLAGKVAILSDRGTDIDEIHNLVRRDLDIVFNCLQDLPDTRCNYSGYGYVPALINGEDSVELYARVDDVEGEISNVFLMDSDEEEYLSKEDFLAGFGYFIESDENGDEGTTNLIENSEIPEYLKPVLSTLYNPPNGVRLYVEMFSKAENSDFDDLEVLGRVMRTDKICYFNIMDAERLMVNFVDEIEPSTKLPDDFEIAEILTAESDRFRSLIRSTEFRRKSLRKQQRIVDDFISKTNKSIRIERFNAITSPEYLYQATTTNSTRILEKYTYKEYEQGSIMVMPIRLDFLDSFELAQGRRIYKDDCMFDSKAGLCMVSLLHYYDTESKTKKSEVLWIPISGQDFETHFIYRD